MKDLEGFTVVAFAAMEGPGLSGLVDTLTYSIGVHHIDRAQMLAAMDVLLVNIANVSDSFRVAGEAEAEGFKSALILATRG